MSIATEINRINDDKRKMRAKLNDLGLVESTANLDAIANAVNGIKNVGAVQAQVKQGESYQIPAGYHNGSGTVLGVVGDEEYQLQQKEVTPSKEQISVQSDPGFYGLSSVTVHAIPEIYQDVSGVTATAADVLSNKTFVASDGSTTAGTMKNNEALNLEIDGMSEDPSVSIPEGYTSGGTASLSATVENALREI